MRLPYLARSRRCLLPRLPGARSCSRATASRTASAATVSRSGRARSSVSALALREAGRVR